MTATLRAIALAAAVTAAALVAGAAPARADKCADQPSGSGEGKNWHWETINGKRVQVIDTVVTVCGKVPRPQVIYILQNKSINYEWENLKQDFLPLILASIKKAPF